MKKLSAVLLFFFCFTAMLFAQDIFTLAESGTPEQIQAAINAGAKIDDRDNDGETPLMYAAWFNENPEVIKLLLDAGARINDRDGLGETPLMHAAIGNENPEVIKLLLDAGARINDRDGLGETPLMYAAWFNENPEVIKLLLDAGARIDDKDVIGRTPLMHAAMYNKNPDVIQLLLDAGAMIDDTDDVFGETPLMYAAAGNENPEVITTLLNAGADPTIKSKEGKTALDYAQANKKLRGTSAFEMLKNATYGFSTDWVNTSFGSYRVERLWQEGSLTYALVSYRNTTSRTFNDSITITALFYDANNRMLDMEDQTLYALKNDPMSPGFESTVKISSTCTKAKRVEVRISGY